MALDAPSTLISASHSFFITLYGLLCLAGKICISGSESLQASVTFHPDVILSASRLSHLSCHPQLTTTIIIEGAETITLHLQKSENIYYHKIPILSYDEGQSEEYASNRVYHGSKPCFYKDLDKYSAISLTLQETGEVTVHGVFHTELYSYKFSHNSSLPGNRNVHLIQRTKNHESYNTQKHVRMNRLKRQTQNKVDYKVELLVVVDYPLYQRWYNRSTKRTNSEKDKDAVDNIKYYYTHIFHEIDMRYNSISTNDYSLSVVLSGIYIAKSSTHLHWEENMKTARQGNSQMGLHGSQALESFGQWLGQRTSFLSYDHAMLFTGYDVYEIDSRTRQPAYNKIGTAYLNGMCSLSLRVSIIEDKGHFESALTAAHELGHSLGASHDGDGNRCDSDDQFVMASSVESRTDENIFRFSQCSVTYFRNLLNRLTSYRKNCMLNKARYLNKTASEIYLKQSPGSKYNPTKQCQMIYGAESYFCGGQSDVETLCEGIICSNPDDTRCYILRGFPAFPGTTCGHKKVCKLGQCVYDADSPETPDGCTFGDTKDTVVLGRTVYHCAELIETYPSLCYEDHAKDLCCESCGKIYRQDRPECAYGDKQLGCGTLSLDACKLNHDVCCGSCEQYMTGIPGCQYGDRINWCPDLTAIQCYLPESDLCCQTCQKHRTNITGCEFGDKVTGCRRSRCSSSSDYKDQCCETCYQSTPAPSTARPTYPVYPSTSGYSKRTTRGYQSVTTRGYEEGTSTTTRKPSRSTNTDKPTKSTHKPRVKADENDNQTSAGVSDYNIQHWACILALYWIINQVCGTFNHLS